MTCRTIFLHKAGDLMGVRCEDRHLLFDGAIAVSSRKFMLMHGPVICEARTKTRDQNAPKNFKRET